MLKKLALDKAIILIKQNFNGAFLTSQDLSLGIHARTLYTLRDQGVIELLSRGLYKIVGSKSSEDLDLLIISHRVSKAVICLESALSFHNITTQIPRSVSIALPKGAETPKIEEPPITVHRFSKEAYISGIIEHPLNGGIIKVYCMEKTIADCFKFRNQLGMDVVIESINLYKERSNFNSSKLIKYAKICRVEKVMYPYLEMLMS